MDLSFLFPHSCSMIVSVAFQSTKPLPLSILWNHWNFLSVHWLFPCHSPPSNTARCTVDVFNTHSANRKRRARPTTHPAVSSLRSLRNQTQHFTFASQSRPLRKASILGGSSKKIEVPPKTAAVKSLFGFFSATFRNKANGFFTKLDLEIIARA